MYRQYLYIAVLYRYCIDCVYMSSNKLATFRIDDEVWQLFQDKAKANGTNASALLQGFVKDYLDDNLDSRIDSTVVPSLDIKGMVETAINSRLIIIESEVSGLKTDRFIEQTDRLLIEKLQTDLAIAHHRIDDLDKKITALGSETTVPKKLKPLASLAA